MIYDDYYAEYGKVVEQSLKANPTHNMSVKPDVWIAFKFLQDRKVEPFEREKMETLIKELEEKQEHNLINAIYETIKMVLG